MASWRQGAQPQGSPALPASEQSMSVSKVSRRGESSLQHQEGLQQAQHQQDQHQQAEQQQQQQRQQPGKEVDCAGCCRLAQELQQARQECQELKEDSHRCGWVGAGREGDNNCWEAATAGVLASMLAVIVKLLTHSSVEGRLGG
eukprot:1151180-Pelagomonas_calceolata.AAC.6